MPLTRLQSQTLRLLAGVRSPESYVAGATVLNASDDTPRYSKDLDIFHDVETSVARCAEEDSQVLAQAGYGITWLSRQPSFQRAEVSKGNERMLIEWVFDSAFRFFPVEPDEVAGWKLNLYDAGTNKLLALMGRGEPRDYIDTLFFHTRHLSLGALCWAAAGKDPGVNPFMILQECCRTTRFRADQFVDLQLAETLDLRDLKEQWIGAARDAEVLLGKLPPEDVGCLYLDKSGKPVTPDPEQPEFSLLTKHYGSVKGAWPVIRPL